MSIADVRHLLGLRALMEARLDEYLEDWDARRVLADLLDDLGEEALAAGQRWQALERRRPLRNGKDFGWFDAAEFSPGGYDPKSNLPEAVFARLSVGAPAPGMAWATAKWSRWYPSSVAADEALARALHS